MSTIPERIARLEEGKEHQDQTNKSLCEIISEHTKHLRRIEVILAIVGAGIGIDRALSVVGALLP